MIHQKKILNLPQKFSSGMEKIFHGYLIHFYLSLELSFGELESFLASAFIAALNVCAKEVWIQKVKILLIP